VIAPAASIRQDRTETRISQMTITVRAAWDSEAKVWYVQDSNVLGLHIEAETREKLYEKLPGAIEDLLGSGEREVEFIAKIAA
jgi:hypothetical protein